MSQEKKRLFIYTSFFALFLCAELLVGLAYDLDGFPAVVLTFISNLILFSLIILWGISIKHRVVAKSMGRTLLAVALFLLLGLFLRFIKYNLSVKDSTASRYLWYSYYLPWCLTPPTLLLATLDIERKTNKPLNKLLYLVYAPAVILSLLVFTNDFHELAFSFGDVTTFDYSYKHEIVYYLVLVWVYGVVASCLIVLFIKCRVSSARKKIWVPLCCLALGASFIVITFATSIGKYFKQPEVIAFVYMMVIESCIIIGLIPSNANYVGYFNISKISAFIADMDLNVVYVSNDVKLPKKELMKEALKEPVIIKKNTRFSAKPIHGGYLFYYEDLSRINKINDELNEITQTLLEENYLISAENELKEKKAIVDEQNRLYDKIDNLIKPEMDKVKGILKSISPEDKDFDNKMRLACLYIAYIKRRSNLAMIMENKKGISSNELVYAIKESLDYLSFYGIKSSFVYEGETSLDNKVGGLIFEFYQDCIIRSLSSIHSCLVKLECKPNKVVIKVILDEKITYFDLDYKKKEIEESNGIMKISIKDNSTYCELEFKNTEAGK